MATLMRGVADGPVGATLLGLICRGNFTRETGIGRPWAPEWGGSTGNRIYGARSRDPCRRGRAVRMARPDDRPRVGGPVVLRPRRAHGDPGRKATRAPTRPLVPDVCRRGQGRRGRQPRGAFGPRIAACARFGRLARPWPNCSPFNTAGRNPPFVQPGYRAQVSACSRARRAEEEHPSPNNPAPAGPGTLPPPSAEVTALRVRLEHRRPSP